MVKFSFLALYGLTLTLAVLSPNTRGRQAQPLLESYTVSRKQGDTVVRLVRNVGSAKRGALVETLRVGNFEGPAASQFASITAIAGGPQGSIFVSDAQGGVVRQFDSTGRFIRNYGRQGAGPGEYVEPTALVVTHDGTLAVLDAGAAKIVLFDIGSSRHQRDIRLSIPTIRGGYPATMRGLGGDGFVVETQLRSSDPGRGGISMAFLHLSTSGQIVDTIDVPRGDPKTWQACSTAPTCFGISVPFVARPIYALTFAGHLVSSIPSRYAIDLRLPSASAARWQPGHPVVSLRRAAVAPSVSDTEREEGRNRVAAALGRMGASWTGPSIPPVKPVVQALRVGSDDRIWVQLASGVTPAGVGSSSPSSTSVRVFEVLELSGDIVGHVSLPRSVLWLSAGGDTLWGRTEGREGEPILIRYRLRWTE
jgi:hypothetical protein